MCSFGVILKDLISCRGVSQKDVADYVGVTQQAINNYVNDRREPDLQTFFKICQFFEVNCHLVLTEMNIRRVEDVNDLDSVISHNGTNYIIR